MVVSNMHIKRWDSNTDLAVYVCVARNKMGSIQSRAAFMKQGMSEVYNCGGERNTHYLLQILKAILCFALLQSCFSVRLISVIVMIARAKVTF